MDQKRLNETIETAKSYWCVCWVCKEIRQSFGIEEPRLSYDNKTHTGRRCLPRRPEK